MSQQQIYTGAWTNWSQGSVLGQTITIPNSASVVLIAVLALLVRWAGSHFWGIVCFLLHYWRSTLASRDVLYYQQQALLRARTSEIDFLWRMYETGWAWRSSVPGSFRRSIPLAILATVNLAGFLAAGIFSTWVTAANSEGLLVGMCGWVENTADKGFDQWTESDWAAGDALFVSAYNGYKRSQEYAATCYTQNFYNNSDSLCKRTTIPYIKSTIDRNAECPFAPEICAGTAFSIDSGLINSDFHLGMNARSHERLEVRKKTSCVPIPMNAYSTNWTTEKIPGVEAFIYSDVPGDQYQYWNLGPSVYAGGPVSNFTFVVSNHSLFVNGLPYIFNVRTSYAAQPNASGFAPIEPLTRDDADVSVLILNNRVIYTGEVTDPFYRADINLGPTTGYTIGGGWVSSSVLNGLACTEQYQFCNPAAEEKTCTPLTSLFAHDLTIPDEALKLTPRQTATYRMLRSMIYFMRFNSFLEFLKNEILVASRLVYGSFGISTPLSENFWHTEIENMFNLSLAGLQLNTIDHAAAPNVEIRKGLWLQDHIVEETDPDSIQLCHNQRTRTDTYTSFSLPGLCILIVLAVFLIVLNISLPKIMRSIQTHSVNGMVARQAWEKDDILAIQQAALEGRGIGPWKHPSGTRGGVPVTAAWDVRFQHDKVYGALDEAAYNGAYRGVGGTMYRNKASPSGHSAEVLEPLNEVKTYRLASEGSPTSGYSRGESMANSDSGHSAFTFNKTPASTVFRIQERDGVVR